METSSGKYIARRIETASSDEERQNLEAIKKLYDERLWHQLTGVLRDVAREKKISDLTELYPNFVREFEGKMNPVELIGWAVDSSRASLPSPKEAIGFLEPFLNDSNFSMRSMPAKILLLSELARLHLLSNNHEESKKAISNARGLVEGLIDLPGHVHSTFYKSAAEFHKVVGTAAEFYNNALHFLSYTPPESLSWEEQLQWAFDLGNAALVGEDIYNYGELLSHGVISALDGTEHQWLLDLLRAFDKGDLTKFDHICGVANEKMNQQPVLVAHSDLIRQKITILALMELAFTKTAGRTITFVEIAETCRLPKSEVEFLLMRALSLKLISGTIDSVDENIVITRVQPRVLGRDSIRHMANRLEVWSKEVETTLKFVEGRTTELVN
eukprot:Plantae.Rhodophyta-Purpureofilum_apyrenoidigerum.ctg1017.p1 GENE.Plantae.Rhodophyta-Purpureofilum_apyrenoidigerum.ctg1017~~Plantae.Rhodophyta-Purpureofilum_apyrenoidigerum.ctg1017.p1  ORF type:complete len:385 (-),score=95.69 Plantae.Rhodophyta-Purpureofilum_apyrenoidigerum.ctg1017:60-1214(-)